MRMDMAIHKNKGISEKREAYEISTCGAPSPLQPEVELDGRSGHGWESESRSHWSSIGGTRLFACDCIAHIKHGLQV